VLSISGQLRTIEARCCAESAACVGPGKVDIGRIVQVAYDGQDMEDINPLIRALALRTISSIHVREYVEAAVRPLKSLLQDPDPYVRKTACFAVAKLYDHDKNLVEKTDLIGGLNSMLRDENQTVVSSALASLMDIWERSETIKLTIDYSSASKIVQILPDCSE